MESGILKMPDFFVGLRIKQGSGVDRKMRYLYHRYRYIIQQIQL